MRGEREGNEEGRARWPQIDRSSSTLNVSQPLPTSPLTTSCFDSAHI